MTDTPLDIYAPIDTENISRQILEKELHPDKFKEAYPKMEAASLNINNKVFVALYEMASLIARVTHWSAKSRIVIEYDPEKAKFDVIAVRQGDAKRPEVEIEECQHHSPQEKTDTP